MKFGFRLRSVVKIQHDFSRAQIARHISGMSDIIHLSIVDQSVEKSYRLAVKRRRKDSRSSL